MAVANVWRRTPGNIACCVSGSRREPSAILRRVHIDVIGKLPTPDEVRAFLASKDPAKRQKKIDELLNHPLHADQWARRLTQIARIKPDIQRLTDSKNQRWGQMGHDWF